LIYGSGAVSQLTLLRILRLVRTVRIVRMFKMFKDLLVLLDAMVSCMRTMLWLMILLGLLLYIYGIMCVELVGIDETFPAYDNSAETLDKTSVDFNNYLYFGTVLRSMNTLFSLLTLSEWAVVSRPISERNPWMMIVLYAFTMTTTFGVMNVVIGVMVEHALKATENFNKMYEDNKKTEQMQIIETIEVIMRNLDTSGDGSLDCAELEIAINDNPQLANFIVRIDLPANSTLHDLFDLIDDDGDGNITSEEFHSAMYRMIYCSDFQRMCLLQLSLNRTRNHVLETKRQVVEMRAEMMKAHETTSYKLDALLNSAKSGEPVAAPYTPQSPPKSSPQQMSVAIAAAIGSKGSNPQNLLDENPYKFELPKSTPATASNGKSYFEDTSLALIKDFEELRRQLESEALPILQRIVDEARQLASERDASGGTLLQSSATDKRLMFQPKIETKERLPVAPPPFEGNRGPPSNVGLCMPCLSQRRDLVSSGPATAGHPVQQDGTGAWLPPASMNGMNAQPG